VLLSRLVSAATACCLAQVPTFGCHHLPEPSTLLLLLLLPPPLLACCMLFFVAHQMLSR
jgi:hypothetical protein